MALDSRGISSNAGDEQGEHGGHGGSRKLGEGEKGSGAGGDGEQRLVGVGSSSPCRERTEQRGARLGIDAAVRRELGARSLQGKEGRRWFYNLVLGTFGNITNRSFSTLDALFGI